MYLYLSIFNEKILSEKRCYFSGRYLDHIKNIFPNYRELNDSAIEGCIGLLRGKENADKSCLSLTLKHAIINQDFISFDFEVIKELDISNDFINKSLYNYARQEGWVNNEQKYYPGLCLFEKLQFDSVRKGTPNTRRTSSNLAKLDELKAKGDWIGICKMYEPLENLSMTELWDNAYELYQLAFACSKLGEPQNGLEKDTNHLKIVRRYRELSFNLYKRCHELSPDYFAYASAVAYRHYQNISELTKPKGRRDGNLGAELSEAIKWLNITLEINPKSIKDNYRKGKLLLQKQIDAFSRSQKEWSRDTFLVLEKIENDGVACLENVISEYQKLDDRGMQFYHKEYIKTLYCLGCFYVEKPKNIWNEFVCSKLFNIQVDCSVPYRDMEFIAKARELFEKCFEAESEISLENDLDAALLSQYEKVWAESPLDKLYRLGYVYLEMYFIKNLINQKEDPKTQVYGDKCERYLQAALQVSEELRRKNINRRKSTHVSERLSHYYIISGNYEGAIRLTERSQDSYIKNTYAIALLLSDRQDKYVKAEAVLRTASLDRYNLAKEISNILLAYVYTLSKNDEQMAQFNLNKSNLVSNCEHKLLLLLDKYGDT